jgi:hypothetical protein
LVSFTFIPHQHRNPTISGNAGAGICTNGKTWAIFLNKANEWVSGSAVEPAAAALAIGCS